MHLAGTRHRANSVMLDYDPAIFWYSVFDCSCDKAAYMNIACYWPPQSKPTQAVAGSVSGSLDLISCNGRYGLSLMLPHHGSLFHHRPLWTCGDAHVYMSSTMSSLLEGPIGSFQTMGTRRTADTTQCFLQNVTMIIRDRQTWVTSNNAAPNAAYRSSLFHGLIGGVGPTTSDWCRQSHTHNRPVLRCAHVNPTGATAFLLLSIIEVFVHDEKSERFYNPSNARWIHIAEAEALLVYNNNTICGETGQKKKVSDKDYPYEAVRTVYPVLVPFHEEENELPRKGVETADVLVSRSKEEEKRKLDKSNPIKNNWDPGDALYHRPESRALGVQPAVDIVTNEQLFSFYTDVIDAATIHVAFHFSDIFLFVTFLNFTNILDAVAVLAQIIFANATFSGFPLWILLFAFNVSTSVTIIADKPHPYCGPQLLADPPPVPPDSGYGSTPVSR
jgi:hypothetical protein